MIYKNDEIVFSYKKFKLHTRKPGLIQVGKSKIYSSHIILNGYISARIDLTDSIADSTKMPMIIKIFHHPEFDFYDDSLNPKNENVSEPWKNKALIELEAKKLKKKENALKERNNYRKKHPIQKAYRKSDLE